MSVLIDSETLHCWCDRIDICPLGKDEGEIRCSELELKAAGIRCLYSYDGIDPINMPSRDGMSKPILTLDATGLETIRLCP